MSLRYKACICWLFPVSQVVKVIDEFNIVKITILCKPCTVKPLLTDEQDRYSILASEKDANKVLYCEAGSQFMYWGLARLWTNSSSAWNLLGSSGFLELSDRSLRQQYSLKMHSSQSWRSEFSKSPCSIVEALPLALQLISWSIAFLIGLAHSPVRIRSHMSSAGKPDRSKSVKRIYSASIRHMTARPKSSEPKPSISKLSFELWH